MNLKEFNELQERYKNLKEYSNKNIEILKAISNHLDIIYHKIKDINDKKLKEDCYDQIKLCWRKLGDIEETLLDNKGVNILIQNELYKLENTDLTIEPLTLEVRKDD